MAPSGRNRNKCCIQITFKFYFRAHSDQSYDENIGLGVRQQTCKLTLAVTTMKSELAALLHQVRINQQLQQSALYMILLISNLLQV